MTSCCRCHQPIGDHDEPVFVQVHDSGSGSGGRAFYAHLPCARAYAKSPHAPPWIGEEIAKAEERRRSP